MSMLKDCLRHGKARFEAIRVPERESLPLPSAAPSGPKRLQRAIELDRQVQSLQQPTGRHLHQLSNRPSSEQFIDQRDIHKPDMLDLFAFEPPPPVYADSTSSLRVTKVPYEFVHLGDVGKSVVIRMGDRAVDPTFITVQKI